MNKRLIRFVALLLLPGLLVDSSLAALSPVPPRPSNQGCIFTDQAVTGWLEFAHRTLTGKRSSSLQENLSFISQLVRGGPTQRPIRLSASKLLANLDARYHPEKNRFPEMLLKSPGDKVEFHGFEGPNHPVSEPMKEFGHWMESSLKSVFALTPLPDSADFAERLNSKNPGLAESVKKNLGDLIRERLWQYDSKGRTSRNSPYRGVKIAVSKDPALMDSKTPLVEVFQKDTLYLVFNADWLEEMLPVYRNGTSEDRLAMDWIMAERLAHALDHDFSAPSSLSDWHTDEQRVLLREAVRLHALRHPENYKVSHYQMQISDFFYRHRLFWSFKSGWIYQMSIGLLEKIWKHRDDPEHLHLIVKPLSGQEIRTAPIAPSYDSAFNKGVEAFNQAFKINGYPPLQGRKELLESAQTYLSKDLGVMLRENQVRITSGNAAALRQLIELVANIDNINTKRASERDTVWISPSLLGTYFTAANIDTLSEDGIFGAAALQEHFEEALDNGHTLPKILVLDFENMGGDLDSLRSLLTFAATQKMLITLDLTPGNISNPQEYRLAELMRWLYEDPTLRAHVVILTDLEQQLHQPDTRIGSMVTFNNTLAEKFKVAVGASNAGKNNYTQFGFDGILRAINKVGSQFKGDEIESIEDTSILNETVKNLGPDPTLGITAKATLENYGFSEESKRLIGRMGLDPQDPRILKLAVSIAAKDPPKFVITKTAFEEWAKEQGVPEPKAGWQDISFLSKQWVGQPSFPVADWIKEAAEIGARQTANEANETRTKLNEADRFYLKSSYGLTYSAQQLISDAEGSKVALQAVVKAYTRLKGGAVIIIPKPYYVGYDSSLALAGIPKNRIVYVDTARSNDLIATPEEIDAALTAHAKEHGYERDKMAKMLLLTSPDNPTGSAVTAEKLESLLRFGTEKDVFTVIDAAYGRLLYSDSGGVEQPVRIQDIAAKIAEEKGLDTLVVLKRIGVLMTDSKEIIHPGTRRGKFASHDTQLVKEADSLIVQRSDKIANYVGYTAYREENAARAEAYYAAHSENLLRKKAMLEEGFASVGLDAIRGRGAFYFWFNMSPLIGRKWHDETISIDNFDRIFYLATMTRGVPGAAFGDPQAYRIAYTAPEEEIETTVKLLKKFMEELDPPSTPAEPAPASPALVLAGTSITPQPSATKRPIKAVFFDLHGAIYMGAYPNNLRPNVQTFLEALKKEPTSLHTYTWFNAAQDDNELQKLGMRKLFDSVNAGHTKEIVSTKMQELGLSKDEVLIITDDAPGIWAAKDLGIASAVISDYPILEKNLTDRKPDFVLRNGYKHPDQVLRQLKIISSSPSAEKVTELSPNKELQESDLRDLLSENPAAISKARVHFEQLGYKAFTIKNIDDINLTEDGVVDFMRSKNVQLAKANLEDTLYYVGMSARELAVNFVSHAETGPGIVLIREVKRHDGRSSIELVAWGQGIGMSNDEFMKVRGVFDPDTVLSTSGRGISLTAAYAIGAGDGALLVETAINGQGHSALHKASGQPDEIDMERGGSPLTFGTRITAQFFLKDDDSAASPAGTATTKRLRVLLADDNTKVRETIQKELERNGFEVVTASNGQEAVGRFQAGKFDVLITDGNMPGKTGEEVINHISTIEPDLPIIFYSFDNQMWSRIQQAHPKVHHYALTEDLMKTITRVISDRKPPTPPVGIPTSGVLARVIAHWIQKGIPIEEIQLFQAPRLVTFALQTLLIGVPMVFTSIWSIEGSWLIGLAGAFLSVDLYASRAVHWFVFRGRNQYSELATDTDLRDLKSRAIEESGRMLILVALFQILPDPFWHFIYHTPVSYMPYYIHILGGVIGLILGYLSASHYHRWTNIKARRQGEVVGTPAPPQYHFDMQAVKIALADLVQAVGAGLPFKAQTIKTVWIEKHPRLRLRMLKGLFDSMGSALILNDRISRWGWRKDMQRAQITLRDLVSLSPEQEKEVMRLLQTTHKRITRVSSGKRAVRQAA